MRVRYASKLELPAQEELNTSDLVYFTTPLTYFTVALSPEHAIRNDNNRKDQTGS